MQEIALSETPTMTLFWIMMKAMRKQSLIRGIDSSIQMSHLLANLTLKNMHLLTKVKTMTILT
jgi:hypothetical protein